MFSVTFVYIVKGHVFKLHSETSVNEKLIKTFDLFIFKEN